LKILHIINALPRAGAEIFLTQLAIQQKRSGADVFVLIFCSAEQSLLNELLAESINVVVGNLRSVYSPLCIRYLKRYLSNKHFSVVHVHLFPSQYWVAIAMGPSHAGTTLVTTEHSTNNRRMGYPVIRFVERLVYGTYDVVVCNSKATRDRLSNWIRGREGNIIIIENGIDFGKISEAADANINSLAGICRPLILCVGRLERAKGQDLLIRAMTQLPEFSLMLIGIGSKLAELRELSIRLGVEDRVCFLGLSDAVYGFMKQCDVYVQPSRWEGFGIAALEALACGIKVVAANVPGLADVVRDRGWLFESENFDHLARTIKEAMGSGPIAFSLPELSEQYSLERVCRDYASAYQSLPSV
jgi:glycosyltransferase involved in cell wall biosynthesis